MKVLKFGGTSVADPAAVKQVAEIISNTHHEDPSLVIVSSAMGGVTNQLIEAGRLASANDEYFRTLIKQLESRHFQVVKDLIGIKSQSPVLASLKKSINDLEDLLHGVYLLRELSPRTMDLLLSFGERLSCRVLTAVLSDRHVQAGYVDARELIKTDARFGNARVLKKETYENIGAFFKDRKDVSVVTGFISSTLKGETTTLGRGGSDYTAALLGAALGASEIQIWTDVDGVMTSDPRQVHKAFPLHEMTYEEAMEMSHFGAKVIYPPTLQPALSRQIPLRIKNTFNTAFQGTMIHKVTDGDQYPVKGISSIQEIALINLEGSGMVGVPGVSSRLFGALAAHQISVILITQASSEHSICFALDPDDAAQAKTVIEAEFALEISNGKIDEVRIDDQLSIVAIIGENMRRTPGISGKMFGALGKNGINVVAIAQGSSERNLSVVISRKDLSKALNTIHEVFFLSDIKNLNVYLIGTGLIGTTLLKQIRQHGRQLEKSSQLKINIVGLGNSRKMLFDADGIDLANWKAALEEHGTPTRLSEYVHMMQSLNLPNSVFADCTASAEVVDRYGDILNASISISTPNKIACSGAYATYEALKKNALKYGIKFLFETNVGAGLPVISTLNDLKLSGDKIIRIDGVLSGTLSYIFNHVSKDKSFTSVVQEARARGYTEPDPREDLNGMDVARKILILAREVGYKLELEDVEVQNLVPPECLAAESVDAFFEILKKSDASFEKVRSRAEKEGRKLRYIATLDRGKASVKLDSVDAENPFYGLSGSDNMISFTTDRYLERPLVVRGPGAGAEVTAAGVFAEMISLSHFLG
jgi:aspartokinase/homoserine dehydrogenase 1